ncbi:MAG: tRNA pseudouridine(38-40) synthase TruA, partial [Ilumatobacter sp.]
MADDRPTDDEVDPVAAGMRVDRDDQVDGNDSPARRNASMVVAYDGTDFHGFAESHGVTTVMGTLRATLQQVLQVDLDLTAAGRTDAGVHGWGQVVTGRLPASVDLDRLQQSVNRMCAPAIAIRSSQWVPDDFDARFSATSRAYRYDVWNHPHPNPLVARTSWHVPHALDLEAMNEAAAHLLGQHDFASFCRRPTSRDGHPEKSLVRILQRAEWHRVGSSFDRGSSTTPEAGGRAEPTATPPSDMLRFDVAATSFCHQMVRSIVGTLVDVGRGRRAPGSITDTLAALDRASAGPVAPPTGLVLWHVGYDGVRWDAGRQSARAAQALASVEATSMRGRSANT